MDVDAALAEVPVNIYPLTDDTDFKTREVAIAYDAAGMDLVWNFVTTGGAMSQTAVTPTAGGAYDWAHQGDGMYSIEIPASGGASINNDTEGFGWFTGYCTGVLPWRGPAIGFRAAALNNALIDGGDTLDVNATEISGDSAAADNLELMFDGTGYAGGTTKLAVDASASAVASVTGAVGSVASYGTLVADVAAAVWAALTSSMTTVGSIGKKLADWVVGTIDTYTGNTKQTGDAYARLGAPAGASIAADIAALTVDAGSGARTVTVTVTDGTDPLEDVHVRFSKGITVLAQQTDASGVATFYCDDGTWTLALSLAGYTYTATTHVVDGTEAVAPEMTAVAIAGAADPSQTNAYVYTYDAHGDLEASVTLSFALVTPPTTPDNSAHTATAFTATSDANGLLTVALMRQAVYRARRGSGMYVEFTTADAVTYALPQVLGYSS
jgi:hypothetical protein